MNTLSLAAFEHLRNLLMNAHPSDYKQLCLSLGFHNTSPATHQQ